MDHQTNLRDVDVLLEVQQAHLQLGDLLLHVSGHLVPVPVRLAALPDKALEVGSHGGGDVRVKSFIRVSLGQGDDPQLAGDALLTLDHGALLKTHQTRHFALQEPSSENKNRIRIKYIMTI